MTDWIVSNRRKQKGETDDVGWLDRQIERWSLMMASDNCWSRSH